MHDRETTTDIVVRALLLNGARVARLGQDYRVICVGCGQRVHLADAYEIPDGPMCEACALSRRFDTETCPDCGAEWKLTVRPCPGCGLTVEQCAERLSR